MKPTERHETFKCGYKMWGTFTTPLATNHRPKPLGATPPLILESVARQHTKWIEEQLQLRWRPQGAVLFSIESSGAVCLTRGP